MTLSPPVKVQTAVKPLKTFGCICSRGGGGGGWRVKSKLATSQKCSTFLRCFRTVSSENSKANWNGSLLYFEYHSIFLSLSGHLHIFR